MYLQVVKGTVKESEQQEDIQLEQEVEEYSEAENSDELAAVAEASCVGAAMHCTVPFALHGTKPGVILPIVCIFIPFACATHGSSDHVPWCNNCTMLQSTKLVRGKEAIQHSGSTSAAFLSQRERLIATRVHQALLTPAHAALMCRRPAMGAWR